MDEPQILLGGPTMIANYHGCPRVVWQGRLMREKKGVFLI
jgi:hypothetical protein